jgi:hypothetical protein
MCFRKFVFVCSVLVCLAGSAWGQSLSDTTAVPLTVEEGFPLQVLLTKKLRFKEKEPVHAILMEPVYAFDREVIPSGTKVEGRITGFQKPGKWKRISTMLTGDFTPLREPEITFQSLVLPSGSRIAIDTSVAPGIDRIVGSGQNHHSDGVKALAASIAKPSVKEKLKGWLWGLSPYRPQYLPLGTRLTAILLKPVHFGIAVLDRDTLENIGSGPPAGSIVSVRLSTPLDSRTAWPGAPVAALTTRPVFNAEQRLILPVNSILRGNVTEVRPAQGRHRNGELAVRFTTISPPDAWMTNAPAHQIGGSLVSVQVSHDMKDLRLDDEGSARIKESKKRLIAPVWAFIKAERSLNSSADPLGEAFLGAYRSKFLKQVTGSGGGIGLGLPASISAAMVPPVGIGLAFFSAGRSLHSTFLGRGQDIVIPANTGMEIRVEEIVPAEAGVNP